MTEEFCPRSVLQDWSKNVTTEIKRDDIDGYTNRFMNGHCCVLEWREPEQVKVEQYIRGLSKNIRGDVTSSQPATIDHVVRMAYQLMGQKNPRIYLMIVHEGEKRKGEGDRGGSSCTQQLDQTSTY
ncbi:hypothetical protein Tco_1492759 [Tanacetum coccineum]